MKKKSQRGFTIAEVLIGAAILGLAVATFLVTTRESLKMIEASDLQLQALRDGENLLLGFSTHRGRARLRRLPPAPQQPEGLTLYKLELDPGNGWYVEKWNERD